MAFVLNYDTLTTAVTDYLNRDDPNLIAQIPLFIMLAERNVARDLKILPIKVTITDNFIPSVGVFAKPTRWLKDSFFNIGIGNGLNERKPIWLVSTTYCRQFWPNPTLTGTPKYYSNDYNKDFWMVVPTPDIAYPYEIIYYETPPLIDSTTSTNSLTENSPEILIYATMLEAVIYLQDYERIKAWQDKYDKAFKSLGTEDIERIQDSFSKRGG
jgi:hypothetical protein